MLLASHPRAHLAHLPTPLESLPRLSEALGGPRLLVKRDDQTGLALGGNKSRKLEFLVADALAQGAKVLVTAGAAQSNHCRQTAAAAARVGLSCVLVLGGDPGAPPIGNILLDQVLGAQIRWSGPERRGEHLAMVIQELEAEGRRPYLIPYGGSNAIGALGYVAAMQELQAQLDESGQRIDRIVVASSSGGTQAGMVVGAHVTNLSTRILGIAIDKEENAGDSYPVRLAALATATAEQVGLQTIFEPDDFLVEERYLGGGYGVVGDLEREAISLTARLEGLLLDPVYTARAMGGLIGLIRRGEIGAEETVLFWHTGGIPALFAYAAALT